jgi:hypothetical protein
VGSSRRAAPPASFWQEQARRFGELRRQSVLHSERPLGASYHPDGWDLDSVRPFRSRSAHRWLLEQGAPNTVEDFKSIAGVCAVALGSADNDSAWVEWLDCLRRESVDFRPREQSVDSLSTAARGPDFEVLARGLLYPPTEIFPGSTAEIIWFEIGEIADVCSASERVCRRLADEALKVEIQEPPTKRQSVVEPLLTARGWSTLDWAKAAGVDYNTARDYLNGLTTPRRDTLRKLAEAIEVNPADMPI